MASTFTHAATGSIAALMIAHVQPRETTYVLAALVCASILDLDHLYFVIRDREFYRKAGFSGNLHNARSIFHEVFGLLLVGLLSAGLYFWDPKLALILFVAAGLHLVIDWLLGKSQPFAPLNRSEVQFFKLSLKQKVIADLVLLGAAAGLWAVYLK
jgi:hypothetical protein